MLHSRPRRTGVVGLAGGNNVMKTQEQLINNIIGQLNGINKMMDSKKDCFSVLTQMKAVKSAMSTLMNKYLEENFSNCMSCKSKQKVATMKKLIVELTNNN